MIRCSGFNRRIFQRHSSSDIGEFIMRWCRHLKTNVLLPVNSDNDHPMTSLRYTVLLSLVFMNYEIETVFTSATKLFQKFP